MLLLSILRPFVILNTLPEGLDLAAEKVLSRMVHIMEQFIALKEGICCKRWCSQRGKRISQVPRTNPTEGLEYQNMDHKCNVEFNRKPAQKAEHWADISLVS